MQRQKPKGRSIDLSLDRRFIFLGRNSGIHGLGHLFRENAHFFARLFWLIVLLVSLGCLYILLIPLVARGPEVSYTAETRYLPWTTTFPAITVCEMYIAKTAQNKLIQLYPDFMNPLLFDLKRYITDLSFNNKAVSCRGNLCSPCGGQVPCDLDWRKLIEKVRKNCTELLTECKQNDKPFDCCSCFRRVDSESGPCYSFNTLHGENPNNEPLFSVNRSTGPGKVTFRALADVQISVHSTQELSTTFLDDKFKFMARPLLRMENVVEYTFSMVDFENDPELDNDVIETRGCRYLHEVPEEAFDTYKVYSYGACKVAHDTEHAFEHCHCVHPCRDLSYKDKYCNFTGMNCLVNYETQKSKLGLVEHDEASGIDPCLPSCVESELTTVHLSRQPMGDRRLNSRNKRDRPDGCAPFPEVSEELAANSTGFMSVGGLVGLFFGASIFSLVEIFYLFLRK